MKRIGTATIIESNGVKLPAGESYFVTVPVPPSSNSLFTSAGKKRVKTKEYRAWLERVIPTFQGLLKPRLPCEVHLTIDGEVNAQRDGDNFVKPIHDALVAAGVLPDDSLAHVRGGYWKRRHIAGAPTVTVWLVSAELGQQ